MSENVEQKNKENEKKTLFVIIFTVITMIAEITYGYITKSMSLTADGWHMGTHAIAFILTYAAYILTRKFDNSPLFPSGTEKIGILAAYTSALFLGVTGFVIMAEALQRVFTPVNIDFNDAIIVALIGLAVNLVCIFVMGDGHSHHHHDCEEKHEHEDYNFKAAYYHILADILTSVLAIASLLIGKYFGIVLFDSLTGLLGGILICKWAFSILKKTVFCLLDMKNKQ